MPARLNGEGSLEVASNVARPQRRDNHREIADAVALESTIASKDAETTREAESGRRLPGGGRCRRDFQLIGDDYSGPGSETINGITSSVIFPQHSRYRGVPGV